MNLVDDATGTTLSLLSEQETTEAAMQVLRAWIERYGVPEALYVDLKSVYVSPKTLGEEPRPGWTYFSQACEKLGIRIIKAYSPQAKGRVERNHAVYQDRFVKELALQGIHDLEKANHLLQNGFIDGLNARFAKAAQGADVHRQREIYGDLDQIFCWESTRQVRNDWTFQYEKRSYQLARSRVPRVKPQDKIIVRRHLDAHLSAWLKGQALSFEAIPVRIPLAEPLKNYDALQRRRLASAVKRPSPWRQWNPAWLNPSASRPCSALPSAVQTLSG